MSSFDERLSRALDAFREEIHGTLRDSDQQQIICQCQPTLFLLRDRLERIENKLDDIRQEGISSNDSTESSDEKSELQRIIREEFEDLSKDWESGSPTDPGNKLVELLKDILLGDGEDPGVLDKIIPDAGDVLSAAGNALRSIVQILTNARTQAQLSDLRRDIEDAVQRVDALTSRDPWWLKDLAESQKVIRDGIDGLNGILEDLGNALEVCCENTNTNEAAIMEGIEDLKDGCNDLGDGINDLDDEIQVLDSRIKDIGEGGDGAKGLLDKISALVNTLRS